MEINKITTNKIQTKNIATQKQEQKLIATNTQTGNNQKLLMELDNMANRNNISFKGSYELNLSNDELEKLAKTSIKVQEAIEGKSIVKTIVVPNKLVNIVVK